MEDDASEKAELEQLRAQARAAENDRRTERDIKRPGHFIAIGTRGISRRRSGVRRSGDTPRWVAVARTGGKPSLATGVIFSGFRLRSRRCLGYLAASSNEEMDKVAEERELTDGAALGLLDQDIWSLHKDVRALDFQIGGHLRAHAEGHYGADETIGQLQSLYDAKAQLMYEAGRLSVLREQVEERVRTLEDRAEQPPVAEPEWPRGVAETPPDHLDWLRPVLDAPDYRQQDDLPSPIRGEERLLDDMEREAAANEDFAWGQRLERDS